MNARHHVIGTAGHVDHGKTTLVKALTGVDTDRLPEEKARGISIELGFASLSLPGVGQASVIDVPGHERFVRTMVAGAMGIDVVLLVVATDDGVMPQTREHLAICQLLGAQAGVVALSKCDLADAEVNELLRDDVRSALAGTFLERAEIVHCSAHTGEGLDELRAALARAALACPPRDAAGVAYLPVDRVFSKPGFGVVVTGTLLQGTLRDGDDLSALPGPRGEVLGPLKVRGLEVHDSAQSEVAAASRVAINVRGDDASLVARGMTLCARGAQTPTTQLLASVHLGSATPRPGKAASLTLHIGTTQAEARVVAVAEGQPPVAARVSLDRPVAAFAGQRFVLRASTSRGMTTVGGGVVLDPHPAPLRRREASTLASALDASSPPEERLAGLAAATHGAGLSDADARARMRPGDDLEAAIEAAVQKGAVVAHGAGATRRIFAAAVIDDAEKALVQVLSRHHLERPLLFGPPESEAVSQLPPPQQRVAEIALARLVARGALRREQGLVARSVHDPRRRSAALFDRLVTLYEAGGLTPPGDEDVQKNARISPAELRDATAELRRAGLLSVCSGMTFGARATAALRARVEAFFGQAAEMTTADFKLLAGGITRKYAIPLLEWLDAEGVTRRKGDNRAPGPAIAQKQTRG